MEWEYTLGICRYQVPRFFFFFNFPNLEMSAKLTTESARELFVLQTFHFPLFLNWLQGVERVPRGWVPEEGLWLCIRFIKTRTAFSGLACKWTGWWYMICRAREDMTMCRHILSCDSAGFKRDWMAREVLWEAICLYFSECMQSRQVLVRKLLG